MAPKKKDSALFTNFTIQVNVDGRWQNTVEKVLKSVKVTEFQMENDGRVNIRGSVNPNVLLECLRKAGKDARLVHWQYGESSSNLNDRKKSSNYHGHGSSNYYHGDGYGYNNNGYRNDNGYYDNSYPGYGSNDAAYNSYTEKPTSSRGHDPDCSIM